MATTVEDLVVKVTPDGVEDTTEQLERQADQFEETADIAGEQTDRLEGFSDKWQGAMAVFAAGLGIATAGILSNVPILATFASQIDTTLTLIGESIDQLIRDLGGQGVSGALAELNDELASTDGFLEDAVGAFGILTAAVSGSIAAIAGAGSLGLIGEGGALAALSLAASKVSAAAGSLATAIAGSTTAVVALAAAAGTAIGAFGVWILESTGVLDAIEGLGAGLRNIIGGEMADFILTIGTIVTAGGLPAIVAAGEFVKGFLEGGFSEGFARARDSLTIFDNAIDNTADTVGDLLDAARGLANDMADAFVTTADTAFASAQDITEDLINGLLSRANELQDTAADLRDDIADELDIDFNAWRWGNDMIEMLIAGIEAEMANLSSTLDDIRNDIEDALSFDIVSNDRMAMRWGADLVHFFDRGMQQAAGDRGSLTTSVDGPTVEMPDNGHAFSGRERRVTQVMLDGREIARAVGDDQSQGVNFRGRF